MSDGVVLAFPSGAVVATRRTPVASWVSDSGEAECTFLVTTTSKASAKDRAELVSYLRDLATLFESTAGASLFEE